MLTPCAAEGGGGGGSGVAKKASSSKYLWYAKVWMRSFRKTQSPAKDSETHSDAGDAQLRKEHSGKPDCPNMPVSGTSDVGYYRHPWTTPM